MRHHNPYIAIIVVGLVTLGLVFLLGAQQFHSGATTALGPGLQEEDPVAVIKSILVNGAEQVEVPQSDMKVTRLTAEVQGGQTGMLLVPGDEIGTGPNAKVTLLFLDAAPEKDNEVLIDSNARMRVGSIFNLLGRVLVRSKGRFKAGTQRVTLDETGTEYELVVQPDGTNRIRILDGALRVQKGSSTTRDDSHRVDEPILADSGANFLLSSFSEQRRRRPAVAGPVSASPTKMDFIAARGKTTRFEREFVFTNRCSEKHLFEIKGPRNMSWFQIMGADKFEVEGRQTNTISFAIKADTTQVPIGVYEGEIIARCVNCTLEQSCDLGGLILRISVSVIAAGGGGVEEPTPTLRRQVSPTPQVSPPVNQTSTLAQELQQVILGPDGMLNKNNASPGEIDETLNWSNEAIVASQPTYSAQSIIPHLQSWRERAEQFRVARRGAILNNDPDSYEALGRIYVDWGNGAKAVDELRKAVSADQTPERLTSLGEAYRLTGDLPRAQNVLAQTARRYPDYAPGLNALGNVYFDQAKVAQDKKDYGNARTGLQAARQYYDRARINSAAFVISKSNIGETELALGDIAREQGRLDEALNQYKQAERTFSQVEQTSKSYVFATKGLGDVYRGMSGIAMIQQDTAQATATFARSQEKYFQALQAHRDVSESYIGLGQLYEDHGRKDDAIRMFGQAIRVRPDMPQGYYHYAVAIADRNPGSAAAYARAYLKLEREVLKQGEKAGNARKVVDHRWVPTPTPTPTASPTSTRTVTPTPTPTPTPSPTASPVRVPGVNGDRPDEAMRKLRARGLDGQIKEQPDCKANGRVVATSPKRDERVPRGTMVTLFISSLGENAVTIPSVTNQSLGEAQRELQRLGLVVDARRKQERSDVAENTVVRQDPRAGSKLNPGCTVELTVSIPIRLIPVPRYIGLSRREALGQLPRFSLGGLVRGRVTEVDSRAAPGTVVDQNPKPGEMVQPGTSVDLFISRSQPGDDVGPQQPPDYAVVPNLYGLTKDQAQAALANAHLTLGQVSSKVAEANQPVDRVIDQYPKASQKVPLGTAVNVTISYQIGESVIDRLRSTDTTVHAH